MKKRLMCLAVCILLAVLCVTVLAACGGSGNGTYYRYTNGSYSESSYITIDGDTWTDSSGATGSVERNGDRITLYMDFFGEKEIVWEGTCKDGVLTLTDGYDTEYYCQKGKAPGSSEQGGDDDNGNSGGNSGGVIGDGPDVTLSFRTQGGKALNPITAPAGSSVTVPTPEYDGYIFKGWYLSSDYLPSERFESATMPNKNTTLWAKWEKKPDEYKNDYLTATDYIKWNDSHYSFQGEKMMVRYTSDQYRSGSTYNLNTGIEAKSGYNIMWYRDEECSIAIGTQRDEISYGNNIYYATIVDAKNGQFVEKYMINVYLRHDYTYTYYPYAPNYTLAGQMQSCYTERVIEDDTTRAPQAPQNGYSFARWVTENRYGDFTEYNYDTPADGNRSFYAEWRSVSLTVDPGENATLLAGDSTTVTFTPYSSSSIGVIPTTETQVFVGYYVGNTRYFDEDGQILKPLPASALESLEARYGETSDKYLNFVSGSGSSGYTVSLKLLPTYETKIVIPSTYNGRPVIALANYAFRNEKTLTGISVPASVTTIGTDAFYGCSSLRTLVLPITAATTQTTAYTVQNDASYPFSYSNGVLCSTNKAHSTTSNFRIVAGSSVTVTFSYMASSESGCDKLVILKNGTELKTMSGTSNSYTSYSVSLSAGDTLTFRYSKDGSVNNGNDCAYFKDIQINSAPLNMNGGSSSSTPTYAFGSVFSTASYDGSVRVQQGSASYYIPQTLREVTVVGTVGVPASAFVNCTMLERVVIRTANIGSNAFSGCTGLTSVAVGSNVRSIGSDAFSGCTALTSIDCLGTVANWCGITGLEYLVASGRTLSIDGEEVTGTLVIPDGVTSIAASAFRYCTGLTSVTIPASVTSIGSNAFAGCTAIRQATLPTAAIAYIPKNSLQTVVINGGTSIPASAFSGCTTLTSVTVGSSVTDVGSSAFSGCTGLKSITVETGNTKYHSNGTCLIETASKTLVLGCKNSIIPTDGSVTSIGSYAFAGYTGLTSIAIPASVTSIGSDAFTGCTALATVNYAGTIANWCGITGLDYLMASGRSLFIDGKRVTGALVIPDGVTGIAASAFRYCTGLTSVTLPASVTSIGSNAFDGCTALTTVNYAGTIANWCGVTGLDYLMASGRALFIGGNQVTGELVIPDGVTSIAASAFRYCTGLTSVTLPASVRRVGANAFSGCSALASVNYSGTVSNWCGITGLEYLMASGRTLSIGGKEVTGELVIPTGVTSIAASAFRYCTGLTSVTIPASVTSVGANAFNGCTSIQRVTMPAAAIYHIPTNSLKTVILNGGTSIPARAFMSCTALTSITIPASVTSIGTDAFSGCTALTTVNFEGTVADWCGITGLDNLMASGRALFIGGEEVKGALVIPNGVTSIAASAFRYCTGLTSVTIPASVTSVGANAFDGCTSIQQVTMPAAAIYHIPTNSLKTVILNGGTSIPARAFMSCTALTSITIPASVTSIGSYAFDGCTALTTVNFEGTVADWCGITGLDNLMASGRALFIGGEEVKGALVIPNGVTSIAASAFRYCTGLTSVTIPASVTSVGANAFDGCTSIQQVTMPTAAISYIPQTNLQTVVINGGTSISASAFSGCTTLTSVTIGNSVTSIGASAFSGCSSLTSLTIPFVGGSASATSASSSTLFGYIFGTSSYTGGTATQQKYSSSSSTYTYYIPTSLKQVTVTGGQLFYGAFYGCSKLTSVTIGDTVTSIGSYAFQGCTGLTSVTIPASVTSIGSNAFSGCTSIRQATLPTTAISYIPKTKLQTVVINGGTSISASAFSGCATLTSITIPASVTSIGENAFYNCTGLTSVTVPASVTSIASGAFAGCSGLTGITVETGNTKYYSSGNCLIETASKTLIVGCKNSVIPSDVKSIGSYAFRGCTGLTSVTVPTGVMSIGTYAFRGCTGLTSVTIPASVTSIGTDAFSGCTSIRQATLPTAAISYIPQTNLQTVVINGGTSISASAFSGCAKLTSVTIGSSVTSIGSNAFYNCTGLTSVTVPASVTSIASGAFSGCSGLTGITVSTGNTKYYSSGNCLIETASKTLVLGCKNSVIPSDVKSIGSYAFAGCTGLSSVTLPASVTSMGSYAFEDCTGLTSVTIPASVTNIGTDAFSGCTAIRQATLPTAAISYIPQTNLQTVVINSGTSISASAFSGCTTLTSISIPASVTSIGSNAFNGCSALANINYLGTVANWCGMAGLEYLMASGRALSIGGEEVTGELVIPTGVTSIAASAFRYCTGLTSITIPAGVTSIGENAFNGCTGLTSVTIPADVTSIGTDAFSGCTSIRQATLPTTAIASIPQNSLQTVVIDSGTSISASAFSGYTTLTSVTLPASVTSIGYNAFNGCTALTTVNYAGTIANWCGVTGLEYLMASGRTLSIGGKEVTGELVIPDGVTSIAASAFRYCTGLTSVTIPASVTSIGASAFSGCSALASINYSGTVANWCGMAGLEYLMASGRTLSIGGKEVTGELVIPAGVTRIGAYAFRYCTGLTSVTIPASVTSIGTAAFTDCTAIRRATIPAMAIEYIPKDSLQTVVINGGTSIPASAFKGCTTLTSITIPASITSISENAFSGCTSIQQATLPTTAIAYIPKDSLQTVVINGGTSIPASAFENCTGLTSVTIGDSVTSIGDDAFRECTGMNLLIIGNSVTSIGENAFMSCMSLTSVTIPASVTSINHRAFDGCIGLTAVHITDLAAYCEIQFGYRAGPLYCAGRLYLNNVEIKNLVIPDSVTSIGDFAFGGYTGMTSLTIGSGVTSIGNDSFEGCTGLTSVTIPSNVKSIGCSFYNCTGLTSVIIENGMTSIGGAAFEDCTGLTTVTIPNSVTSIEDSAFDGCTSLTTINIPNSVTSIGERAFLGCTGLTSIIIPNSVTSIGDSAFVNCTGLTSITIPNSVTSIGDSAFVNCTGLTSVYIGTGVSTLPEGLFSGCSSLASITIPFVGGSASATSASSSTLFGFIFGTSSYTGGTKITQYYASNSSGTYYYIPASLKQVTVTGGQLFYGAFYGCSDLTSVTIGDSVTEIGSYAFYKCTGLTSTTIGSCVTSIGGSVFSGCTGLTSVTVGSSVTSIGYNAFNGCTALVAVNYAGTIADWCGITGLGNLMASDRVLTINGEEVKGALVIPTGVTSIAASAFRYCTGLTSVTIPASVTSIGSYAFQGCTGLTSVTIPASVTSIGTDAFSGCIAIWQATLPTTAISYIPQTNLQTVVINGGTSISASAFSGCTTLTSITIPASVTSIGYDAFRNCTGLTSVTIPASVTSIGSLAFNGCTALATVNYAGTISGWCRVSGLGNLMASGRALFIDGKRVTGELVIPDGVTSIADSAFRYSTGLTSVTLPASVRSIGENAFSECTALTSVNYVGTVANWCGITGLDCLMASCRTLSIGGKEVIGELIIPDGVTSIASSAFYGCTGLTSIIIPNSVTSIGNSAFVNCTGLTSVYIGTGVSTLPEGLFSGCSSLASITIPFVGGSASATSASKSTLFGYIFGTDSYTGGTATKQYYSPFSYTTYYIPVSLKQVTVTGGQLFYGAFENCTGLTSVTIPNGVTSIGENAFYDCTGLKSVTIGSGVTSIGAYAFRGCTGLTSVTFAEGSQLTSIGSFAFCICTGLTSITIPNRVTDIGCRAFLDCTGLTSVTFAEGSQLMSIGESAFSCCTGLTSITIPNSVTSIGDAAFMSCTGLTAINIPNSVTSIGGRAFDGCTSLTTINIPNSVTSIGERAFYNCTGLTSIYIGTGVSTLPEGLFSGCSSLVSLTIPFVGGSANATSASSSTLFGYIFGASTYTGGTATRQKYSSSSTYTSYIPTSLKQVTVTGGQLFYGAFYGCSKLTSVTIGDGVTSIGSHAFSGCSSMTSLTIPFVGGSASATSASSLTLFGYIFGTSSNNGGTEAQQYYSSYAYETYYIPSGLKEVTVTDGKLFYGAFYGCSGLTSVTIGDGVTSIGENAFSGCIGLTSVTIPDRVTSIGSGAFSGCSSLTTLTIPFVGGSASATSASSSTLFGYIFGTSSYTGGTATKQYYSSSSSPYTYYIPTSLKQVTVTGGKFLYGEFRNCTGLTSVTIPNSVTSIGDSAFRGCTGLTSVTIGNSVTSIGDCAFYSCSGLTSITIPNSVKSIGRSAFYNCTGLTSVTIGNGVTSIGETAFRYCTGLTSITIPNSVTSIGDLAFCDCTGLTVVTIPNSVKSIGRNAFYDCSKLTSVTFENTSGWYYTSSSTATSGSSMDVTNASTNATNLVSTYTSYYWKRNG